MDHIENEKLGWWGHRQMDRLGWIHRQQGDFISLLLCVEIKASRLKKKDMYQILIPKIKSVIRHCIYGNR
jgi:hypothetical protein